MNPFTGTNADQRKDEFPAMLGHELRNPLTPISNMVHLMNSQPLDESTLKGAYKVLSRNITHIIAQSQGVNQGAEFTVKLPIIAEPALAAESFSAEGSSRENSRKLRILVIDDNRDVADSLVMLFEMLGYQVKIARDGPQGLLAAQSFAPDIILLDIGLPYMDGYEVACKLREQDITRQALIIAMSGYAPKENDPRVNAAGFDHYLIKPPDIGQIQNLIAEHQQSKLATK